MSAQGSDDFRALLENAINKGDAQVVIPPGTYRLAPLSGNTTVDVNGAKNLTIIADGVTLICTRLTRAVAFTHCANVTLRGLTVDYDPLPFTQGTVTQIAPDFSWIDVKLDAGYPRAAYSRIDLCDPKTRHRKRGMPYLWGTSAAMVGADTVRVTRSDIGKAAAIGDLASLNTGPINGAAHAVSIDTCSGMAFDHVTVFSAPGFGLVESDGDGGMRYEHCRVVPGPIPPGATEPRLLSTSWDAIQSKMLKHGPVVEDCDIVSAGDDSWSVQSSDYLVMSVDGSKAVLAFRDQFCEGPQVGDRVARSLASAQPIVVSRQDKTLTAEERANGIPANMKNASPWDNVGAKAIEITVAGAFPFAAGDSVYCPDRMCNGFVFRNNRVHSPGRILVKAGDGLIENNEVIDCHSGVTVNPEVPGASAAGIANLVIRGNLFRSTGWFCPLWNSAQAGSVSVTSDGIGNQMRPAGIYRNIVIENNRFDDIKGPAIVVTSAQGVTIKDNIFCHMMTAPPERNGRQVQHRSARPPLAGPMRAGEAGRQSRL